MEEHSDQNHNHVLGRLLQPLNLQTEITTYLANYVISVSSIDIFLSSLNFVPNLSTL